MASCDILSLEIPKACPGKCEGGSCSTTPRVWVVAACEGRVALFAKHVQGPLTPLPRAGQAVFASLDDFQKAMKASEHADMFDQLVLVGSRNDVSWLHATLPPAVMGRIAAEIEYPLLSAWFMQPLPMAQLTQALQGVFAA